MLSRVPGYRLTDYRITWADLPTPSYHTSRSARRAVEQGRHWRGHDAPIASVAVLARLPGPGQGISAAGGYWAWVDLPRGARL